MALVTPPALIDRAVRRDTEQTRFAIGMNMIHDSFARAASITEGRADPTSRNEVFQCRLHGSVGDLHPPGKGVYFGPGEASIGGVVEAVTERAVELAGRPFER